MSIKKSYAVFGLGRYGRSVAAELVRNGVEVLAVDSRESVVNAAIEDIPLCKCADVTDAAVIKQLGISNFDVVIIAMASCLEASVMATTLCKEVGVETVIAKCSSEMHKKVLLRVGADKVVLPESESGTRLAKNLLSSGFVDVIELSKNVSMIELEVLPSWEGKSLIELNLRKKYSINVVAVKEGDDVNVSVDPTVPLDRSMTLIVIADTLKLDKIK